MNLRAADAPRAVVLAYRLSAQPQQCHIGVVPTRQRHGPAEASRAQKNSKYSRISQSLTSWPSAAGDEASASWYRPISKRFIMTR